jgi:hypothetical protein
VFEDPGWITHSFREVRKDLFVLYDGGWDIPLGVDFTGKGSWHLGSFEVAIDKFPTCTGSPAERLRKLNEMTQTAGWRGAGVWAAAQAYQDGKDGRLLSHDQMVENFRERARWSREAGIGYWKVDFGARGDDPNFHRLVTEICRKEAPGLVVEHARTCGPVNDEPNPWETIKRVTHGSGRYAPWDDGRILANAVDLLSFTNVLRTYDVLLQLSVPTTLDRVAQLLKSRPVSATGVGGLLLCEDEVYIGAALGCAMGIMRSQWWRTYPDREYDPYHLRNRVDEAVRAVRWQRLAPAFPAWQTEVHLDDRVLTDDWYFKEGETGADWLAGQDTHQGAPARVSRGMPLPEVKAEGELPYVIASRHPNGAISVATLPRASKGKGIHTPLADITIAIDAGGSPVGVFGQFRSLGLRLSHELGSRRLWAQDLAGDVSTDITQQVDLKGRTLILPGNLINRVGRFTASPGDISNPGIVLKLLQ